MAITAGGLLSVVGSGGGFAIGFPPCDAPWCDNTPPPPEFSVSVVPAHSTVQVGAPAQFTAVVKSEIGPASYRWFRAPAGGTFTEIQSATTSSILVGPADLIDDGTVYRVQITGVDNPSRSASADGVLYVSSAPGIVIADGEFVTAEWTATAREYPPGVMPVHSETREVSGGNPGAWLKMVYQIPADNGSASVSYLRGGAIYDPRASGAIHVIDYAEDCRVLQSSDYMYTQSELVFEQAGRRYTSQSWKTCNELAWRPVVRASFKATGFAQIGGPACGAGESCPDFSASATPLQFGFRRITWGAPGDVIGHGIDYWTVTVWRP